MHDLKLPDARTGPGAREAEMSKALARRTGSSAVVIHGQKMDGEQLDLLTRTICKDAEPDEFALFVQVCNRTGLDPFSRQIHAVKRWDGKARREVMSIQTGIDGYRLIAQRSGEYAGSDEPVFDVDDATHPGKATITVYKVVQGTRCPVTRSARWDEYAQTYKHRQSGETRLTPLWAKMPYTMLAKCAEAQALRAAFPQELSGVYTNEEMMQSEARGELREVDGTSTQGAVNGNGHDEPAAKDAEFTPGPPGFDRGAAIKELREKSLEGAVLQAAASMDITLDRDHQLGNLTDKQLAALKDLVFDTIATGGF